MIEDLEGKLEEIRDAVAASEADVVRLVKPALRHRLILNFAAEADRVSVDGLLHGLIDSCQENRNR